MRKWVDQVSIFGNHFVPKLITNAFEDLFKKRLRSNMKIIPKGFQKGAEINAQTHKSSAQTGIAKDHANHPN